MLTSIEKTMLGFVVVFLTSALWPNLPHYSLIAFAILLLIAALYFRVSALLNGLLIGFVWSSITIHAYVHWQIDNSKFNQNLIITGVISTVIHQSPDKNENIKFNFIVNQLGNTEPWLNAKIRLSWHQPDIKLYQGQKLRLFIRLKAPVGLANPEGFNYQKWLASQNIVATGYVKASPSNQILVHNTALRQTHINKLVANNLPNLGWILALTYGDRSLLTQSDWEVMQNTGTAHLFAISGMHLGIVFAFVFFTLKLFLYLPCKCLPQQFSIASVLLICACLVSVFYAYIAGFQVPVMRALLAVLMFSILRMLGRYWRMPSVFLLLLVCFFVLFPYAHLGVSFWFSFSAVGLILWFCWRFALLKSQERVSRFKKGLYFGIYLQLFLSLATLPIVATVFGIVPITSFLANLVMIPLVTFLLVPLCLVNAILITFDINSMPLMQLIDYLFEFSLKGLKVLSMLGNLSVDTMPISVALIVCVYISLLILLFPTSQYRIKALASFVILISASAAVSINRYSYSHPWEIVVFDVGQGTSIVVRQRSMKNAPEKFMLYDTGPSFGAGFSMARAVVIPYFEALGLPKVDYLVLSHLDNDHAGGSAVLEKSLKIKQKLTPNKGCHGYQSRQWHSLRLEIIWPLSAQTGDDNNHSCVIKISSPQFSILLTGDIESAAEKAIIRHYSGTDILRADILIAPHHGSATSSTLPFVDLVRPSYVIFTAGYKNRWEFPDQDVLKRYRQNGAVILNTGKDGRLHLGINDNHINVSRYRQDEYSRWYFLAN